MRVFYTKSTQHLAHSLPFQQGNYRAKQFSDGEWYIRLEQEIEGENVWVITATNSPADNLIELFLLLDALQRSNAKINLLFTYFGYARQDSPLKREASGAELMGRLLKAFTLETILIIHPHSALLHTYLPFKAVFPDELICQKVRLYDAIAAPDRGAYELVRRLAHLCDIEPVYLTKMRPEQETVKILEYNGNVNAKRIMIIDDMIVTGKTAIEVAKKLRELGATHVSVWATHGIFSADARHMLEQSGIEKIYVTDSLVQKNHSRKIEIVSIASLIEQVIKQT